MSRLSSALALAWLVCVAVPRAVEAANSAAGTLSLVHENDLFNHTDRNYTNGVQLSWVPGDSAPPAWALHIARQLPWFPRAGQLSHGYLFGQSMFTPHDITLPDPPQDDRPYAGWLYGTIALSSETGRQLDQFALTLGVVGPASMAEQSQKFIHKVTGSVEPRGWDTQLENELGIMATYQRSWRGLSTHPLNGLTVDLTPHLGGALGNVFTYANSGLTMRIGKHLPLDFGPPRIQPSIPGSGVYMPQGGEFSWYLFGGVEGRAVARNIFLDGNTFRDSRSVEKKPLVGDLQLGIVLDWSDARLSYTHVLRSREFENQRKNDGFGVITLTLLFSS
ncbi:MAG TPA: lipid A deacylase LpxR family protein [Gammaproteobacteria bacterium]